MGPSHFEQVVTTESPVKLTKLGAGKTGALLATYASGMRAVIKPVKHKLPSGKTSQRGIPVVAHPNREVAYYRLAYMLGFDDIVPITTLIHLDGVLCSAQVFVPAMHLKELNPKLNDRSDRDKWRTQLRKTTLVVPRLYWKKLLILDLIAGVRDRHANNVGVVTRFEPAAQTMVYRLVAWDNAVTFGDTFHLYHNVFHKLLFRDVVNLDDYWEKLTKLGEDRPAFEAALEAVLGPRAVDFAWWRLQFMLEFPYKLPWKIMSKGTDDADSFPDYSEWFDQFRLEADLPLVAQAGA